MKNFLFLNLLFISSLSFAYDYKQAAEFESTNKCIKCDLDAYTTLPKLNRNGAILESSILSDAQIGHDGEDWSNSDFSRSLLAGKAKLNGNFNDSDFTASDITTGAILYGDYTGSNFSGVVFYKAFFYGKATKVNFLGVFANQLIAIHLQAEGASFDNAKLIASNFENADFTVAKFINTDFTNSDLEEANFTKVDFTGANLTGVNLRGALLCGSNISDNQLKQAANLSCATKPDCNGVFPSTDGKKCNF